LAKNTTHKAPQYGIFSVLQLHSISYLRSIVMYDVQTLFHDELPPNFKVRKSWF